MIPAKKPEYLSLLYIESMITVKWQTVNVPNPLLIFSHLKMDAVSHFPIKHHIVFWCYCFHNKKKM